MKRFNLSAWAVSHPTLVLFLMIILGAAGYFSYQKLGRAEDPFFTVKVVNVSVMWPGATSQEMQMQVADPIEKKLQELPFFDKVQTYSKPGFTAMQVSFKDSTSPKDVPYLFYLIRKKLVDVQGELPSGILGPVVNDEFSDVDSILYMMTGDGADYAQLKKVAEGFRQRLLKVPGVTKIDLYGTQDERIFVEFSHAKLATLGITPQALFDSLAKQNNVTPAGTVETSSQRVPLRVTGALDGVKAVAETPVESNGRVFRLGDIATVSHGYVDPPSFKVRQEGKPALGIGVVTAKGANILELGKEVQQATAEFLKAVPQGVDIQQIADQPKVVEHAVGEFVHSFVEALAIVLFVSFVALGWRTGIVVALSVPLVLGIVFIVMNAMSLDLHRITLGALIIALGLLVDDAIIAVEMMVVKMEQGWDRMKAASFAWESTAFPMLTGTLVTAAGFLPIGFANSAVGEYAGGIFWIVAIALVASWFVAVIFTPYIGVKLLPNIKVHQNHDPHAIYETRMYRGLRSVVQWCVDHRIKVVVATVGVFVLSIVGFGHVQQQFFPLSERPELFLQLRLPEGTAFNVTEKAVKQAEGLLKDDQDIQTYTAYVGQGSPRFWLGLNPQLPNEAFAEIVILAKNVEARERVKAKIEQAAADGALNEARVRVDRFNFGPPVGFPVQFRVIGPDANKVRDIAYQVREVMRQNKNVKDVQLDWNEQSPYLKLAVDQDRARALGLTPQDVSQALAMLISGAPVTTIRDGIEKVGVVARAVPSERLDLGRVGDLTITTRNGVAVPLQQIAKIEYAHEEPILWRRNRDMAITVRSDVVDGVQAPDVTNQIAPKLKDIQAHLEPAYRIEPGGAFEESAKGNASIFILFPVMVMVMLTLLMIQLQSFSRLFLVFLTAPLGIVGASLGLNVANQPFGFVALLGLIALAGMIMRNAVILVDQIESDVSSGLTRREAIVEATVRRARPVVLTALAAILAMIPLSRSAFWGPMAITIMGGLFVATFLTLLYLPGLYALWFRKTLDESGPEQVNTAPQHAGEGQLAFPLAEAAE
ncbi:MULTISPECIES: efflux RND transporter permease subunit [unclassified Bradyrhizobium]|uniref:efflux RND transporter permease subunit n=1 Tax=unclassified Bradyrhizobium TaxID=2631580 RepID=UPI001BABF2EF|nr:MULTISPECIES: efflux RND transporter permease subunit [unclassified Bradyrhizobium]MBR1202731.1 efflux RND transporter permease subunit [Bradyrhizobium sp. AUGA SZCCT0124]MBR1314145.1 efflux RND transporter permease subunit [Bradyrhizobium sp. AUGA SZCCT0051]MBR1342837.1 efflux RND transporter permease subunit [Bradyrhizobium sp. AUGA SZCCT0105]MBR1353066.1 efflux RND transporter permease subunit [Bradyrhizobium sp. AUGA SZCCT0045]